ncbi:Autoinducer synthetase [Flavimaricola marinus]|uniref:Autoinducer synthetase n=2 Tax=Flavimaricola marinus TaxID=1819565 RepID=A0A238LCW5_9RHOB|nr:Autoinducer synthetase [Flavimaricola marinus]
MSRMDECGWAYYDFLRLRKSFFVDNLGWDIPHDGVVEMDQYDTPLAHYSVVVEGRKVIAGARCQPTTTTWGRYSNMLNDAASGFLDGIPKQLFDTKLCGPDVWEGTRLVVADDVTSTLGRMQCLALVIDGLIRVVSARGATSFLTLSPLPLQRTAALVGLSAERITPGYQSYTDGREYAIFRCKAERAVERLKQLGIDPETHEVVGRNLSAVG